MRWSRRRTPDPEASRAAGMRAALRGLPLRANFKRAVFYGLIALAALVVGQTYGDIHHVEVNRKIVGYGCAVLVAIFGIAAARNSAREVDRIATLRAGAAAGAPLRLLVLLVGLLIAVFSVLDLLQIDLSQLLVGGAVTGVVVGIAAQQVLGNLFAGLVMLFARPYVPGQYIRVHSGAIGGPHDGTVETVGLLYTTLRTETGPMNIPNSALLASAVGPLDPPEENPPLDMTVAPEET